MIIWKIIIYFKGKYKHQNNLSVILNLEMDWNDTERSAFSNNTHFVIRKAHTSMRNLNYEN